VEYFVKGSWLLCLTVAALEDLKTRQVSLILLLVGSIPGIWALCIWGFHLSAHLWAASVGVFMLLLSRITKGALGEGDGYFFLFSALYWNTEQVCLLFLGSLGIGCIWGMGLFMYERWNGKFNRDTASIPFLTCVWPVGVWMVMQCF
jgi:leader peptidase (prepilin peptidase)/N-methyltransferase